MSPHPPRSRPSATSPLQPSPEPIRVGDRVGSEQQTHGVPDSQSSELPDSQSSAVPHYQRLVRKELRVRADQADALAGLRRQLTADRDDRSERLTDNTLVRVAIDWLLHHQGQLHGDTEQQLRDSLTDSVNL